MKSELICWDASVLIEWIKGDDQNRMSDIKAAIESTEKCDYKLVVSTLIYVEVLESAMSVEAMKKFHQFIKNREQLKIIAVDIRVAEKAQSIRNRTSVGTPDAIHLATAIVGEARIFHTFDKKLLSLNEKEEVDGLVITACELPGTARSLI